MPHDAFPTPGDLGSGGRARSLRWAPSVAMTWFWGLGFFYSIHVTLTYGLLGFLSFAVPNALGLYLFGRLAGGPNAVAASAAVERGRTGLMLAGQILAVSVSLLAFHDHMLAPLLGEAALPVLCVVVLASFVVGHLAGVRGLRTVHAAYFAVGIAAVALLLLRLPAPAASLPSAAALADPVFAGLVLPTLVGFALGPWCDVQQWHKIAEIRKEGSSPSRAYAWGSLLFFGLLCINHALASAAAGFLPTLYPDGTRGMEGAVAALVSGDAVSTVLLLVWGMLALSSTLDAFHASVSRMMGGIVAGSVNPLLAFVPPAAVASPVWVLAVASGIAWAMSGLPMMYLMMPFATLLAGSAAALVLDVVRSPGRTDATLGLMLGLLSALLFAMGWSKGEGPLLVALSPLVALGVLVTRRPTKARAAVSLADAGTEGAVAFLPVRDASAPEGPGSFSAHHGFRDGWFEMTVVPTYDDTNSVGNVYFANYVRWVGKVRELFFDACMPDFDLKTTRFFILTKSFKHDFRREIAEFEDVVVRIRIGDHNRKFVTLEHEILRRDGSLVGRGSQSLMFVDSVDYKPLDIPKDVVSGFLPHWPKDAKPAAA